MNSCAPESWATRTTSSSEAWLGHRDVSRTVPRNMKFSCNTTPICVRRWQCPALSILPVDLHQPGLWLIEALQQPGDRGLARTAAADDADDLAGSIANEMSLIAGAAMPG